MKEIKESKKEYKYCTNVLALPNGRRKYVRAKTEAELEDKLKKLEELVAAGVRIDSNENFGQFTQRWFDYYKKPYLREKSLDIIKYVVNDYILPPLGSCIPYEITPMQIQALMAGMRDKSFSLQSKVLVNLRDIFKAAEENGLVAKSPVSSRLKAGGKKTEEKEPLTPSETMLLLERVTEPRARTFLLLCLHTGVRRGEALALKYSDIDFKNKVIHIRRNAVVKQKDTTASPDLKTKAGKRDVPLTEELETWLKEQKCVAASDYIFVMKDGKLLTTSAFHKLFAWIDKALPERHITAHILRHTYITRLFEAGLDLKEIQYLAGHSSVEMTLRVYAHYDRLRRESATGEKVRAAFSGPQTS